MNGQIVLIDLSSIAYPIWHMSQAEPDPNATSTKVIARIRALANGHQHVAICCDAGRSFRFEISNAYKANRGERSAPLMHQIDLAAEALANDGFPVWRVPGFEADDLIATATAKALELPELTVLIVSADKDILQLVCDRVQCKSVKDGSIVDADAVKAKFGVRPDQMLDYLSLVGDASDNVRGAKGIGPTKAADLLGRFESIATVYRQLAETGPAQMRLQPSIVTSLKEFEAVWPVTRSLITLRVDAEIPFHELASERMPRETPNFAFAEEEEDAMPNESATIEQPADTASPEATQPAPVAETPQTSIARPSAPQMLARAPEVLPPVEWERQLDPRDLRGAQLFSSDIHASRMFSDYGNPQAVLTTVMLGRELGLTAMASLRGIHIIEGRHGLSAQLMVAIILKSGLADYFLPVEVSDTKVTYKTHRKGESEPFQLTHTIEMAARAGLVKPNSNWAKTPEDMLVARCTSRLARMKYADLLFGLYTPEELREIREQQVA